MMTAASSLYHCVGTCHMGPRSDPWAVVDARLRVYGLKKLRIIDASVFPLITRGKEKNLKPKMTGFSVFSLWRSHSFCFIIIFNR